jgi:protoporphyrinogen/coproporphyrinogen III oxidase
MSSGLCYQPARSLVKFLACGSLKQHRRIGLNPGYTESMPRIVIVGGGLSGLATAFRIRQALPQAELIVLESRDSVGGNIRTEQVDQFTVEHGPNGLFDAKPHALQLCRDLGLGDRLIAASEGARKNRYLFLRNTMFRLPGDPLGLLRTPLLSWRGKFDLLTEPFRRRTGTIPADESVAAFAQRRFGREAAETFIDGLVTGVHAGDPELLSVRSAFPRLAKFEATSGSVIRGALRAAKQRKREMAARGEVPGPQRIWSFREGLQVLIDRLAECLGRRVQTGTGVCGLSRTSDGWTVLGSQGQSWNADWVILTTPAHHQSELLSKLDPVLSAEIGTIRSSPIAVVALGYREEHAPFRPDGFGYIAPQNTRRDVLGVQWCSSIYPNRAPAGCVLWRALCGGINRPDMANLPEEQLIAAVHAEMQITMGVTALPIFTRVIRWPRAIPQYEVGHSARLQRIAVHAHQYHRLLLAGSGFHGVALNDCCEQAESIAKQLVEGSERSKPTL